MFLHIGSNVLISARKVIVIYDVKAKKNDVFLAALRERDKVRDISEQEPKSCIVTDDCAYLSSISVATLQSRFKCCQKAWKNGPCLGQKLWQND